MLKIRLNNQPETRSLKELEQDWRLSNDWREFRVKKINRHWHQRRSGFFPSNHSLAILLFALVCLSTNRVYNFSKMIFDNMVKNVKSPTKFLMYPRFIQTNLKAKNSQLLSHRTIFPTPCLQWKVFQNMEMETQGWMGK